MKKENESAVNGFPTNLNEWGFPESTFARPLPEGTYKGEQIRPAKMIQTKDAKREVNGKHSIEMNFVNVVDGNEKYIRSTVVEQLKYKHNSAVKAGKTTAVFSIESGVKGIDLLNPELRFVSDGKNLDVI